VTAVEAVRLYSVAAAAELLGVSRYYIYDRIADGQIRRVVELGHVPESGVISGF